MDASKAPKREDKGRKTKARVNSIYEHDVLTHLNCVDGIRRDTALHLRETESDIGVIKRWMSHTR